MALIVEDGTGKTDAQSYASVAAADAFWTVRGNTTFTGKTVEEKEIALVKAADYIAFAFSWPGAPTLTTQKLAWPRVGASYRNGVDIDPNTLPPILIDATIMIANEALSVDLLAAADDSAFVTEESVAISGAISETRKFDRGARTTLNIYRFSPIDALLADLFQSRKGVSSGFRSIPLQRS